MLRNTGMVAGWCKLSSMVLANVRGGGGGGSMRRGLCCGEGEAWEDGFSMCLGLTTTTESALLGRLESALLSYVACRFAGDGDRVSCRSQEFECRCLRPERPGRLIMADGRRGEGVGRGESMGDTLDAPSSPTPVKKSPRPAPALIETRISSVLGRWCGSTDSNRLRYL